MTVYFHPNNNNSKLDEILPSHCQLPLNDILLLIAVYWLQQNQKKESYTERKVMDPKKKNLSRLENMEHTKGFASTNVLSIRKTFTRSRLSRYGGSLLPKLLLSSFNIILAG